MQTFLIRGIPNLSMWIKNIFTFRCIGGVGRELRQGFVKNSIYIFRNSKFSFKSTILKWQWELPHTKEQGVFIHFLLSSDLTNITDKISENELEAGILFRPGKHKIRQMQSHPTNLYLLCISFWRWRNRDSNWERDLPQGSWIVHGPGKKLFCVRLWFWSWCDQFLFSVGSAEAKARNAMTWIRSIPEGLSLLWGKICLPITSTHCPTSYPLSSHRTRLSGKESLIILLLPTVCAWFMYYYCMKSRQHLFE